LKEKEDKGCSSYSPIKLGRSVVSVTKRNFDKEIFKYKGVIHPHLREARHSAPLNPFLCKVKENNEIKELL
jgi:hypothetical protein